MEATLGTAANVHFALNLNGTPTEYWMALSERLVSDSGFERTGDEVIGLDEKILPSSERHGLELNAGYDNWSGHHLLSASDAGDYFLTKLFNEIRADQ